MNKEEQKEFMRELRYIETLVKSINERMYSIRDELSEIIGLCLRLQKKCDNLFQDNAPEAH